MFYSTKSSRGRFAVHSIENIISLGRSTLATRIACTRLLCEFLLVWIAENAYFVAFDAPTTPVEWLDARS